MHICVTSGMIDNFIQLHQLQKLVQHFLRNSTKTKGGVELVFGEVERSWLRCLCIFHGVEPNLVKQSASKHSIQKRFGQVSRVNRVENKKKQCQASANVFDGRLLHSLNKFYYNNNINCIVIPKQFQYKRVRLMVDLETKVTLSGQNHAHEQHVNL